MDTIPEESHERALGRDEGEGFKLDVTKVAAYLKQIILWVRVLIVSVLVLALEFLRSHHKARSGSSD